MTVLEDRYRSVLRLLPRSYRQTWENDMVATFLESTATDDIEQAEYVADFGRPSASEVASVAALAARLRLGGADAEPRSFAWGEAVRRMVLVVLLVQAAVIAMDLLEESWRTGSISWLPEPGRALALGPASTGVWDILLTHGGLFWVGAYFTLVFGERRGAAVLASIGFGLLLTSVTLDLVGGGASVTLTTVFDLALSALLVLGLASFHAGSPPVRRRPWVIAFGIAMLVGAVPEMVFLNQGVSDPILFDWPGVACGVMVAAALVHLLGPVFGRPRPAPTWSLALALIAPIVLVQRIASLIDLGVSDPLPGHPETMILAGVEAFVVLIVLLPLVRLGRRTLGGLPATRTGADGSAALNSSLL